MLEVDVLQFVEPHVTPDFVSSAVSTGWGCVVQIHLARKGCCVLGRQLTGLSQFLPTVTEDNRKPLYISSKSNRNTTLPCKSIAPETGSPKEIDFFRCPLTVLGEEGYQRGRSLSPRHRCPSWLFWAKR